MTTEQINIQLAEEGLRLAAADEAGWYVLVWDEVNETTVKVWATEFATPSKTKFL